MQLQFQAISADDIFISYSRRDGNTYAAGLADVLTRRGFSCFFDKLGTDSDRNLPPSLITKIKNCGMLVVVGSAAATQSEFVAREVEEFARARGTSRAVPIYFEVPSGEPGWQNRLVGIAPEVENLEALSSGNPSTAIVNRIEKSFKYVRSKDRLRRYAIGVSVVLALLVIASIGAAFTARSQFALAREATTVAETAKASAEQQKARAESATKKANQATINAAKATKEAENQQRLATLASEAAKREREKANRETLNAKAAGLVSMARGMSNRDPMTASLLLTEANGPSEPPDGSATARELLDHFITKVTLRGHKRLLDDVGMSDVSFSPDGTLILTVGGDETVRVWTNDKSPRSVVLKGPKSKVVSAKFSPDGERVMTAWRDGTIRVWRTNGSGLPVALKVERPIERAGFSPNGQRILAYGNQTASILDANGSGRAIELNHDDVVMCATFSPDGDRVFTGTINGFGRIWIPENKGEPLVLKVDAQDIFDAQFSPDGKFVAIASLAGGARVWRADATSEPVILGDRKAQVQALEFSPDGKRVAIGIFGKPLEIWSADGKGPPVRIATSGVAAKTIRFSKDGRFVLVAMDSGGAELWNSNGEGAPILLRGHTDSLTAAVFSPNEREIATASYDATARIWTRSHTEDPVVLQGPVDSQARFSSDGRRIVAVASWPPNVYEAFKRTDSKSRVALAPTVLVWNSDGTGSPLILRGHEDVVIDARFSPDGAKVLTVSWDGTARIWPLDEATEPVVFSENDVLISYADFSPDGKHVLTVTNRVMKDGYSYETDGIIRIWPVDRNGEPVVLRGHKGAINSATFSRDGLHIVTAGKDSVRIWPSNGRGEPVVLRGPKFGATDARFDPTGRRVVSVSEDPTVILEASDGTGKHNTTTIGPDPYARLGVNSSGWADKKVEFSPDGRHIAILIDNQHDVILWDVENSSVNRLRGHSTSINSVQFSKDGKYLVTSSDDGSARIWLSDGKGQPLVLQSDENDKVRWAEFSPDQTRILTVAGENLFDRKVRVWTIAWKELVAELRARTSECLSIEQRMQYLGDGQQHALNRFSKCEREFGRSPVQN